MSDEPLTPGLRVRVANPERFDFRQVYHIAGRHTDGDYRLVRDSGAGYVQETSAARSDLEIVIPQIPTLEETAQARKGASK